MHALKRVSRALERIETALMNIGALAMFLIMVVVVVDVTMRYLFSRPLIFTYDLISMYLVVILFFFALPDTLHRHGHIAIDFFVPHIPRRVRHVGDSITYIAATLTMVLIAWRLSERTSTALSHDEVTATSIAWPLWLSSLPAAIGCWMLAVRLLYRSAGHLLSALIGRTVVEVPPSTNDVVENSP